MLFTAYRSDPYCSRSLSSSGIIFSRGGRTPPSQNSGSLAKDIVAAAQFTIFTFQLFQTLTFSGGEPTITPRYPAHAGEPRHAESLAYSQSLELWNKLPPIVSHIRPDFPEPYELPVDGLRGEKRVFLVILFTSFSRNLVSAFPGRFTVIMPGLAG